MPHEAVQNAGGVFEKAGDLTIIVDAFGSRALASALSRAGGVKNDKRTSIRRKAGRLTQQKSAESELDGHAQNRAPEFHCCDPEFFMIASSAPMYEEFSQTQCDHFDLYQPDSTVPGEATRASHLHQGDSTCS